MDPLISFCDLNSQTFPYLTFDERLFWHWKNESSDWKVEIGTTFDDKIIADADIHKLFSQFSSEIVTFDDIVHDRGNPFLSLNRYVEVGDNITYITKLFNFEDNYIALRKTYKTEREIIDRVLKEVEKPKNILIEIKDQMNYNAMQLCYFVSKFYRRITLIRPIFGHVRYLVGIDFVQDHGVSDEIIDNLKEKLTKEAVKSYFEKIPTRFELWFKYVNNIYMTGMSEFFIHMLEAQKAYKTMSFYWSGQSYDIRRALNILRGNKIKYSPTVPKTARSVFESKQRFRQDMHLYTGAEISTPNKIHTIIDLEKDDRMPYRETHGVYVGGIHWGQRKLLLSEIDFITQNTEKEDQIIAIYIGAAPFDHGPALLEMYENMRMVLVDPRNKWNEELKNNKRVSIITGFLDISYDGYSENENVTLVSDLVFLLMAGILKVDENDYEEGESGFATLSAEFKQAKEDGKIPSYKILFFSDIRRDSYINDDLIVKELGVHKDMTLQKDIANEVSRFFNQFDIEIMCSLKFHVPFVYEIGGEDYVYGKGDLHVQPWARPFSTELRLWWNPKDGERMYNKRVLEDIMMFHNTNLRDRNYGEPLIEGYDGCHDCHYEIKIISDYVNKYVESDFGFVDKYNAILSEIDKYMENSLKSKSLKEKFHGDIRNMFYIQRKENDPKQNVYDPTYEIDKFGQHRGKVGEAIDALMKSDGEIKNVTREDLHELFAQFFIWIEWTKTDLTNEEHFSVAVETFRQHVKSVLKRDKEISENTAKNVLLKLKISQNEEIKRGNYVAKIITPQKRGKFITYECDGKYTMKFHKGVIGKFLFRSEKDIPMSNYNLRHNQTLSGRIFTTLKRYESVWNKHFSLSIPTLFKNNPILKQMILGMNIMTIPDNEELERAIGFQSMFGDLENLYGMYDSLIGNVPDENFILDHSTLFVFLPDIEILQKSSFEMVKRLLNKYSNHDKTIVVLSYAKYEQDLLRTIEVSPKVSSDFQYSLYDVMKDIEVKIDPNNPMKIYSFGNENSTFNLNV